VTITGYDMWVIARSLTLAPEQFAVVVPQSERDGRGFFLDDSGKTFNIALDKQPSEEKDKPCIFWLPLPGLEGGTIGRCGIYSVRPYVCQTYPAYFHGSPDVKRREDVLCPQDAWRDGLLQRPVWRERLLRMYVEYDIYGLAVLRWNYHVLHTPHRQSITALGFFNFLMHYYARLEPLRARFSTSEWMELCEPWCECLMENTSPLLNKQARMQAWSQVLEEIYSVASGFFDDDLVEEQVAVPA
jgi:hypothetical protein